MRNIRIVLEAANERAEGIASRQANQVVAKFREKYPEFKFEFTIEIVESVKDCEFQDGDVVVLGSRMPKTDKKIFADYIWWQPGNPTILSYKGPLEELLWKAKQAPANC